MTFRLKAASGPRTGEVFDLGEETLIGGGSESQIRIEGIAAMHASLHFDGDQLVLEAKNETHVNGEPVTQLALKSGDEIRIGPNRFVLQAPGLRPPSVLTQPQPKRISPWTWIAIGAAAVSGVAAMAAYLVTRV